MNNISKHLLIYGRVQGVFFRESMRKKATELQISGWVRNKFDGSVEAIVQGNPAAVVEIIAWARVGPPAARVDQIEIADRDAEQAFSDFERLPTA